MKLIRTNINDHEKIWKMQKEAFADFLEKYQDYDSGKVNIGTVEKDPNFLSY